MKSANLFIAMRAAAGQMTGRTLRLALRMVRSVLNHLADEGLI
jgi:hypothetical protein